MGYVFDIASISDDVNFEGDATGTAYASGEMCIRDRLLPLQYPYVQSYQKAALPVERVEWSQAAYPVHSCQMKKRINPDNK